MIKNRLFSDPFNVFVLLVFFPRFSWNPKNSYSQLNLYCFTYVLSCILYIATDLSINPVIVSIFCPPLSQTA